MREYKSTYGTSLLYLWAELVVCGCPLILLFAAYTTIGGQPLFWDIIPGAAASVGLFGVASILLVILINVLFGRFDENAVQLTEHTVSYDGKTIPLDQIRRISLYLPKLSKSSSKTQMLTIWANDKNYIEIKRPSIALIAVLKKQCASASFEIGNLKSRLLQCLWIELGIIAALLIASASTKQ